MTTLTLKTLFILAMVLATTLVVTQVAAPSIKVMFETADVIKR